MNPDGGMRRAAVHAAQCPYASGEHSAVRESPDMLSAPASRDRLELTGNALSLAMNAAATAGPPKSLTGMTSTTTPTISRPLPSISTSATPSVLGTRPAAARWCATSLATARVGWKSRDPLGDPRP